MLDVLETIAGAIVLVAYTAVAVVLPVAVLAAFVVLLTRLVRSALATIARLARPAHATHRVVGAALTPAAVAVSMVALLALAGATSPAPGAPLLDGLAQIALAMSALHGLAAMVVTGYDLGDMLLVLQPSAGEPAWTALRQLGHATAAHVHDVVGPGASLLAFRWAFATTLSVAAAVLLLWGSRWLIARRVRGAPPVRGTEASLSEPPRPIRPPLPAVPRERCGIVARDALVASTLRGQLEEVGCEAVIYPRLADALAPEAASVIFVDSRELAALSPGLLPPVYAGKLVAVPPAGSDRVTGWDLDTHPLEAGARGVAELLRARGDRTRVTA